MFKSVTVTKPLPISVFDGTTYVVVDILVSPAPTKDFNNTLAEPTN